MEQDSTRDSTDHTPAVKGGAGIPRCFPRDDPTFCAQAKHLFCVQGDAGSCAGPGIPLPALQQLEITSISYFFSCSSKACSALRRPSSPTFRLQSSIHLAKFSSNTAPAPALPSSGRSALMLRGTPPCPCPSACRCPLCRAQPSRSGQSRWCARSGAACLPQGTG